MKLTCMAKICTLCDSCSALQDKIEVNGPNAHPLYKYLKKATKTGMLSCFPQLVVSGLQHEAQTEPHVQE
jgi:glutathione peroxidase-family protein